VSLKIILTLWTAPKSDVLIVYSPPLLLSFAAVTQKWLRRWPYVLNLHDLYPQTAIDLGVLRNRTLIWLATLIESTVYRNADKIIVAAPASRRILTQNKAVPAARVEMMFNYIDTVACPPGPVENGFRKRNGIEGRFVVLYAGLMGLAQDLTPVIECARQTQHEPDWVFVLAGEGPCTGKWAELSRGLPNVKMVGSLSYRDYYEALQAADICLVALSAAFKAPAVPGKIPTIMAAGRPIVARCLSTSKRILIGQNRISASRCEMIFNCIDVRACTPAHPAILACVSPCAVPYHSAPGWSESVWPRTCKRRE
jgi:colanic acid biosynthesis glycosyl transferase WcaI